MNITLPSTVCEIKMAELKELKEIVQAAQIYVD